MLSKKSYFLLVPLAPWERASSRSIPVRPLPTFAFWSGLPLRTKHLCPAMNMTLRWRLSGGPLLLRRYPALCDRRGLCVACGGVRFSRSR